VATITPSGESLALTSLDLALIQLHRPSLDPAVKSVPLARAARSEASRSRAACEESDTLILNVYEGEGAEDQEGQDSEDEEEYWSSFMQDDNAAASDAASIAPSADEQESGSGSDQEASDLAPEWTASEGEADSERDHAESDAMEDVDS